MVEAKAADVPQAARPLPIKLGTMGLTGILNHAQAIFPRQPPNRVHLGRMPEKMYRKDRFGPFGERFFYKFRIDIPRVRIDIHKNGSSAHILHCQTRRQKGKRGSDDLIAWPNAESEESELQGRGARRDPKTVGGSTEQGKVLLKTFPVCFLLMKRERCHTV